MDVNEPHINDIIMRHKTLLETNQDIKREVQRNQDEIEKKQAILAGLIEVNRKQLFTYCLLRIELNNAAENRKRTM